MTRPSAHSDSPPYARNDSRSSTRGILMDSNTDIVTLAALLSRRLRMIVVSAVACLIVSFGILKLIPNRYTAHASFIPSGPSASELQGLSGSLGGLAATLGLSG